MGEAEDKKIEIDYKVQELEETKVGIVKEEREIEKNQEKSKSIQIFHQIENLFYTFTFSLLSLTFKNLFVGPIDWISQYLLPIFIETTLSQFKRFHSKIQISINFIFKLIQVDHSLKN
jgi:hypothetical protein